MESSPDKIPVDALLKEFNCCICLTLMDECFITKCGHTFCKNCISESINRHHKCPVCNATLKEEDIAKNLAMNSLKKIITEERDKAISAYLGSLAGKLDIGKDENSIEGIFLESLKHHLLVYRKYIDETKFNFSIAKSQLPKDAPNYENQIKNLDSQFDEINQLIQSSLKEHLQSIVPDPNMLDIKCDVLLPQNLLTIKGITLKPSMRTTDLQKLIQGGLAKMKEQIQYFNEEMGFLIVIPPELREKHSVLFGKQIKIEKIKDLDSYLLELMSIGFNNTEASSKEVLAKLKIQQNSLIIYVGDYKLKSESQPECLTYNYKSGTISNYFSCENCGINWICQTCADYCHKGHSILPYLQNKATTWACCYCVKNQLCKAINKDSKK